MQISFARAKAELRLNSHLYPNTALRLEVNSDVHSQALPSYLAQQVRRQIDSHRGHGLMTRQPQQHQIR